MSSPIASQRKGALKKTLISVHQRLSHARRIEVLAGTLTSVIKELYPGAVEIHCLDVGCGDMKVAEGINSILPETLWQCVDVYELPETLIETPRWAKYKNFDGENIPFPDKSMDVVLFCDVLHHAGGKASKLLAEAARVGKKVIVKDHFEYSFYSRTMLKLMDFIGNWGYGVGLPERYFTADGFKELSRRAGFRMKKIKTGIDLYSHLPVIKYILRPGWHFIAVLEAD